MKTVKPFIYRPKPIYKGDSPTTWEVGFAIHTRVADRYTLDKLYAHIEIPIYYRPVPNGFGWERAGHFAAQSHLAEPDPHRPGVTCRLRPGMERNADPEYTSKVQRIEENHPGLVWQPWYGLDVKELAHAFSIPTQRQCALLLFDLYDKAQPVIEERNLRFRFPWDDALPFAAALQIMGLQHITYQIIDGRGDLAADWQPALYL